jgi:sulfonate transport system permease protein
MTSAPTVLPDVARASATRRPASRSPGRARSRLGYGRRLSPVAVLLVWQLVSGLGLVPPRKLPAPTSVWRAGVEVALNGQLGAGLVVSLRRMLLGFVVGALVGAALGVLNGLVRTADSAVDPIMQMVRNVPLFGLIPLLILWFGIGEPPKLVLIALAACLPIYVNVHAGIRDADPLLVEASRVLGYSRWERLRHVVLPGAASHSLVGLRLGVAAAWLALVVAETIATDSGIGYLINNARDFLRTDLVMVGLVVYALVGLVMDASVRLVERWVLRWRQG